MTKQTRLIQRKDQVRATAIKYVQVSSSTDSLLDVFDGLPSHRKSGSSYSKRDSDGCTCNGPQPQVGNNAKHGHEEGDEVTTDTWAAACSAGDGLEGAAGGSINFCWFDASDKAYIGWGELEGAVGDNEVEFWYDARDQARRTWKEQEGTTESTHARSSEDESESDADEANSECWCDAMSNVVCLRGGWEGAVVVGTDIDCWFDARDTCGADVDVGGHSNRASGRISHDEHQEVKVREENLECWYDATDGCCVWNNCDGDVTKRSNARLSDDNRDYWYDAVKKVNVSCKGEIEAAHQIKSSDPVTRSTAN